VKKNREPKNVVAVSASDCCERELLKREEPLIPSQTVLRHHRRTNARIANAASVVTAAGTVSAACPARAAHDACRWTRSASVGAGHEVAAHAAAGELTGGSLAHFAGSGDGAGALVASLLLAVAAGNIDHGRGVDSSAGNSTNADADRASLDGLGGTRVTTDGRAITVHAPSSRGSLSICRLLSVGATIHVGAWNERNSRVDHGHERLHRGVFWLNVEGRIGVVHHLCQLRNQVLGDVCLRQCCDVVERCGRVERHQTRHDHLGLIEVESMRKTFWEVRENLTG